MRAFAQVACSRFETTAPAICRIAICTDKTMTDTTTINKSDAESGVETDGNQRPAGDALAGCPGNQNDVRTLSYRSQRHEFNGQFEERVPSSGWRAVYAAMEVGVNADR